MAPSCRPRALLEVDEQDRNRRGGDTRQSRGLAERARPRLDEALACFVRKSRHLRVIDLRRQARLFVPALALDLGLLALDVARVLLACFQSLPHLLGEARVGGSWHRARRERFTLRLEERPASVVHEAEPARDGREALVG